MHRELTWQLQRGVHSQQCRGRQRLHDEVEQRIPLPQLACHETTHRRLATHALQRRAQLQRQVAAAGVQQSRTQQCALSAQHRVLAPRARETLVLERLHHLRAVLADLLVARLVALHEQRAQSDGGALRHEVLLRLRHTQPRTESSISFSSASPRRGSAEPAPISPLTSAVA